MWSILQQSVYQKYVKTECWWTEAASDWSVCFCASIQQSVADQATDQWRVHLNACVKAKGKYVENMLWCAVPQLSIICYETYIQLFLVSKLLTTHDFQSFSSSCWTIFGTFIEFRTVKHTWSAFGKCEIFTPFCYKYIQVTGKCFWYWPFVHVFWDTVYSEMCVRFLNT